MSRIHTPDSIEDAPEASQPLLRNVEKLLGTVPNMFRLIGNSPAALEGYLGINGALGKGRLDARTRERIALAVAAVNGCSYCLAAHTYLGRNLAKLGEEEIAANRRGTSLDPKADAAVRFAVAIVESRGHVDGDAIARMRSAGYADAEIVEVVAHVALNTLTNYVNEVFGTAVDFPAVEAVAA
ncbi:MAG: carboxymuconolactone decarboxylase family protein [Acuticoccus sp.]